MVLYLTLFLVLSLIVCEWYIMRRFFTRRRWLFAALAAVPIVALVAGLFLFSRVDSGGAGVRLAIWCIGLFFITAFPALVFAIISLLDYPARWIAKRDVSVFTYVALAAGAYVLGTMLWGATAGRDSLRVERVEISSPRLPASFDGLRVAVFADVHMGNLMHRHHMLRRIVAKINGLEPDMVAQCGDLVNIQSGELDPWSIEILSGIRARYGVWSVLGNHDIGFYIRDTTKISPRASIADLAAKTERMGWRLLRNQTGYFSNGIDSIAVSGVNYPADGKYLNSVSEGYAGADLQVCYDSVPRGMFNIMLSHTPALWADILDCSQADLTLSGHVHAMQMKFGWGRNKFSPAQMLYPEWSGLYERDTKYLYINDGIGYVLYPLRINARPEITLITLRSR